jgi:hypothetical protein
LLLAILPGVAFAGCSGSEWTYHPSAPNNNHDAWGCDCSEKSKNYNLWEKPYEFKNLYDGNKNLCDFPKYSECIDVSGTRDVWDGCKGKYIHAGLGDGDSLPKNATAVATDGGWEWKCNDGFEKNAAKNACVCSGGLVMFEEKCVKKADCESMAGGYEVKNGECVKQNWCSDKGLYDSTIHTVYTTEKDGCMDFKCLSGYCFESLETRKCAEINSSVKWGGTFAAGDTGLCIKCPANKKKPENPGKSDTSVAACVAPTKQYSSAELSKCWKCEKDEFKKCVTNSGKESSGQLLPCAKCLAGENQSMCYGD